MFQQHERRSSPFKIRLEGGPECTPHFPSTRDLPGDPALWANQKDVESAESVFDQLLKAYTSPDAEPFQHPFECTLEVRKLALRKWIDFLNHAIHCLVLTKGEPYLNNTHFNSAISALWASRTEEWLLGRLVKWSRRLHTEHTVISTTMRSFGMDLSSAQAPDTISVTESKQWHYVRDKLLEYKSLYDDTAASYIQVMSLHESQASNDQARSLGRITLIASLFVPVSLRHQQAKKESVEYNEGAYGKYVLQNFTSADVSAPVLNTVKSFTNCDDGSYLFITPRGEEATPTLVILDASGSLIWTTSDYHGQLYNLQVQEYRGKKYLTFWAGNDSVGGHGEGLYYILDQQYKLYKTINAANGLGADLHSFTITPSGSAILTAYDVIEADLQNVRLGGARPPSFRPPPGRPLPRRSPPPRLRHGYIWDCLFQEIDLETGELLFEWRASQHFDVSQSYDRMKTASRKEPWDWFHINSVEKDAAGNYLISSRHLRTIAYIAGDTGDVLWQLGGRSNSFQDLSGGRATTFIGQHDAHWAGSNAITLFDNRADWSYHTEHRSLGTRVELDFEAMTATLAVQFVHPEEVYSVSQGSCQTLPNGNVLLGYGNNGVITEFAADGTVLCDAYFEPTHDWTSGNVQSYRNLKFNWTGLPNTKPGLAFANGALYMSWLGSTEIRQWLIQHSSTQDGAYRGLLKLPKSGFETQLTLGQDMRVRQFVQVTALDADGRPLAVSHAVDIGSTANVSDDEPWGEDAGELDDFEDDAEAEHVAGLEDAMEDVQLLLSFAILALLSSLLI
ncbi:hypothetical protein LTR85_006721 [Meristemomyces frigidus]|nr:hypothetical protein LTR85_006721 [Meristemomyces frigidus]